MPVAITRIGRRLQQLAKHRLLREETGAELVEAALASLILFSVLIAIVGFSLAMYYYHYVSYAAAEGARFAAVRGTTATTNCSTVAPPNFVQKFNCEASSTDVQNYVQSLFSPATVDPNVSVTTTYTQTTPSCSSSCSACSDPEAAGCYVKVVVSYQPSIFVPLIQTLSPTFTSTAYQLIQY